MEELSQIVYKRWFRRFQLLDNDVPIDASENWEITKLDSIVDFKNGKKVCFETGEIPVYGGNGILGYTKDFNAEDGIAIGRV